VFYIHCTGQKQRLCLKTPRLYKEYTIMKHTVRTIAAAAMLLLAVSLAAEGTAETIQNEQETAEELGELQLSAAEREGLLLMREEEKLARDVYLALAEHWNVPIFSNIARSESAHMEAVARLLNIYGIDDPVGNDVPGEFANPELAALYTKMLAEGKTSVTAALQIGAAVEDLDIKDLQELLRQTDEQQIIFVYENLLRGSESHIRAFTSLLAQQGIRYEAQYTDSEYLADLLDGQDDRGRSSRSARNGRR
jgi:hypothetical protein